MEDEKNGYEVKQNGKDYIVLIDLIENNKLIIKCLNKSTGDFFSSKYYELEDLRTMNKYFRITDNIKEIQSLLNTAIEKVKMGLLEDFTQMTIFFYLMLGLDENTIAFPLIKEKNITTKSFTNDNELKNTQLNKNYLESLENENTIIKKEKNMLKEEMQKLFLESSELKKKKDILKEDNESLREQNQKLLEFKKKYEMAMMTPTKNELKFQGEMKITSMVEQFISGKKSEKKMDQKMKMMSQIIIKLNIQMQLKIIMKMETTKKIILII
jgi:hypothetical protein